jgi:cytoskeleton-associated protein 5
MQLGDQKEVLRARVRSLVKFIPTIYPASKLFAVILENGAVSKNARTRAESLEELTFLVQRHGASVYSMPKILPLLGTHIGDKDAASRSAALQLIGAIYTLEGDAVYAFLKGLSVKDQGLLDERLKRTSTTAPSAALPSTPIAKSSKVPLTNGNGIDRTPDAAPAPVRAPAPSAVVKVEDERLLGIGSANEALSVEALKAIQKDIANRPASLMITADALIHAIVEQMQRAFSDLRPSTEASTLRLCKHLMQTLSAYFDEAHLSKATSQEALVELLAELARRLLETADCAGSEAIGSLSKVLNMVLIRIFHNADKNACFG